FSPIDRYNDNHTQETYEDREWENVYRSTHGVNCTGSCSWKDGIVTWEGQELNYPTTGPDMPDFEPRGASYSWYLYSANRGVLWSMWQEELQNNESPLDAWKSSWQEVNELIAASNVYTVKTYGPDRVAGFSPIPAMSMVSYASGARTPDAHFFTEVRVVSVSPDFAESTKLCDLWLAPKQGTDAAMALAMGHVMLREFHLDNPSDYFLNYCRQYTDFPFLVTLSKQKGDQFVADRAADLVDALGQENNPEWKPVLWNENTNDFATPHGTMGSRGKWNLEQRLEDEETGEKLSVLGIEDEIGTVRLQLADGSTALVTTVYDLTMANYGLERGLGGQEPKDFNDDVPFTPAWQEKITGVPRELIIQIAREFADNADKTHGRAVLNLVLLVGAQGVNGGGWAHYVGQEKLRPAEGWQTIAMAKHMNSTSYFYNHSSQWRYETVTAQELLSPMADKYQHHGDYNVLAARMGWLPSAPQLGTNPLRQAGMSPVDYTVKFAAEQPENGKNHPRNLFVWRSNLLGSSGKGHEYMLKYLLGTENGIQGKQGGVKPEEVEWKLSSTCLYSDIVLPTATWYEKDDMNTSDMHPFIHPLSAAVDPAWESKSDWDIFTSLSKKFSEVCVGHLGKETDVVTLPIQHDSAAELAQPLDVKDWKGECEPIPGKTMPQIHVVERDYPATYERFTSIGPLMEKGIAWNTQSEMDLLRAWAALSEFTGRDHTHLALNKEDEKFRDIQAQPRTVITSPAFTGSEKQSFYLDHDMMKDFGESLLVYRPPIDTRKSRPEVEGKEITLNYLTPHNKGGPIVWISETDARDLGIEDNDWIEVFNSNGALTARVPAGMTMMYHAQERGGIHNSVTRPTHMIGGYAQLAYGFNYYGTVGSNRDEFVVVRNINWLDGEGNDQVQESVK
uniref:Respiratory nitrate reductase alpha chain (Fragments) n=1 Tax=Bradyrhizobium sp. TaxID=376 RepID=NARG_BRASZ|nr:RecName: Full=Respiratory nitrate reductase alpha chain; AltName: Full=Respiratory membrane-bound nitrate reductase subunit alpha [Bradyrhizobium sp.]